MSKGNLKHTWEVIGRLYKVTRRYLKFLLLGVLATIFMSCADSGLIWLLKPVMDKGFIAKDAHFLFMLPFAILVLFLIRGGASFCSRYFINRVSRNVVMIFRQKLFKKYLRLPLDYFDANNSGQMLSTLIYNVEQVSEASSDTLIVILRESTYLVGLITVMFISSWQLSSLFIVIVPPVYWLAKWSSVRMKRLSMNVQDSITDVTKAADAGLKGNKLIKLSSTYSLEVGRFNDITQKARHRELKIVITNALSTCSVQMLMGLPIAGILAIALFPSLHITPGSFAVVITALFSLLRPLQRLSSVNSILQKGVAGAESIFSVLDLHEEVDSGTISNIKRSGVLEVKDMHFQYKHTDVDVLRGINLLVRPGESLAVVGRSGAGKSTLVNLLTRFYLPQRGGVFFDNLNINDYKLDVFRRQFAFVSQQTFLFDDTIANNILYGVSRSVSPKELDRVIDAAYLRDFVDQLPQGVDTLIGQDGVLLSGGQRQRMAIARALLRDAPILILDEATSSLDSETEFHIQAAIDEVLSERTSIVIAHRLSTIEKADNILVLDGGEIIEQGSHRALLAQSGLYSTLHRMQFKEAPTPVC